MMDHRDAAVRQIKSASRLAGCYHRAMMISGHWYDEVIDEWFDACEKVLAMQEAFGAIPVITKRAD